MPRSVFVPPSGPPTKMPDPRIFAQMGEAQIRKMMADFYRRLAHSSIADMFPTDPEALFQASQRSADFFVAVMGGPDLFRERHGEPMMRRRHLRFVIDTRARKAWLDCFFATLDHAEDYSFPPEHLANFKEYLEDFSLWMVNQAEGQEGESRRSNRPEL